ncbi:MAG: class I SAM-dependent methyltransferase [Saprospiraceae bacterium]
MSIKQETYIPALGYDRLSNFYDRTIRWTMPEEKFRTRLVQQVNLKPGEKLLEFGFGTASQTVLLKQQTTEAEIIGVDVDPKIRELALEKVRKAGLEIQLDLYEGKTLPYPDATFDKVVSSLVFHQLDRTQKASAFGEIYRVLKPGGELHIGDWGKARHIGMRLAFLLVQLLDGFKTTNDNLKGLLPGFIENAGFLEVAETGFINTGIGTFSFYKSEKSK